MRYEQLSIYSFMEQEKEKPIPKRLSVGDYVGRLVLGEIEKGRIYEIEGDEEHFFYRTDSGCFYPTDRTDFEQMEREAEGIRKQFNTIEISRLDIFFSVRYPPRSGDGKVLYAMTGIFQNMLFWKERMTYQFLEKPKNIKKAYEKKIFEITHTRCGEECEYEKLDKPIPIHRLYWSNKGFYAEAKYVKANG